MGQDGSRHNGSVHGAEAEEGRGVAGLFPVLNCVLHVIFYLKKSNFSSLVL